MVSPTVISQLLWCACWCEMPSPLRVVGGCHPPWQRDGVSPSQSSLGVDDIPPALQCGGGVTWSAEVGMQSLLQGALLLSQHCFLTDTIRRLTHFAETFTCPRCSPDARVSDFQVCCLLSPSSPGFPTGALLPAGWAASPCPACRPLLSPALAPCALWLGRPLSPCEGPLLPASSY